MANQIGRNPWVIDTADPGELDCVAGATIHIGAGQWVGYDSAADEIIVTDAAGNQVFKTKGRDDLSPIDFPSGCKRMRGIIVPTLSAGKLILWLK